MRRINKPVIIVLVVILIGLIAGSLFIFLNQKQDEVNKNNEPANKINLTFSKNEAEHQLMLLADINLKNSLKEKETIGITIEFYDQNDKLIDTYQTNLANYVFTDDKNIKIGLRSVLTIEELNKISDVKGTYEITKQYSSTLSLDYETTHITDFKTINEDGLTHIPLDIDESYNNYGGLVVLNYKNNEKLLKYITYFEEKDYVGVFSTTDISTQNGSPLESIDLYRSTGLFKKKKD